MAVRITRPGKNSLILETPVMPAAGTVGYGEAYRDLCDLDKLGAFVTNPVTLAPWTPATGTRVVPLEAGVLIHTGLPNPGLSRVLALHREKWRRLPLPVILHLVLTSADDARRCMALLEEEDAVDGIELGLNDDLPPAEAARLVHVAVSCSERPLLVRLPFHASVDMAKAIADAGADGLVACAPPRGTARDAGGRLVAGRIYGPLIKPLALRTAGLIARSAGIPVIGAGGIHSAQDARDYLDAGAVAVQIDSATWIAPHLLEMIARDLGGLVITQPSGALPDEWHPGMGETEREQRIGGSTTQKDTQNR